MLVGVSLRLAQNVIKTRTLAHSGLLAETVGFEPTDGFTRQTISRNVTHINLCISLCTPAYFPPKYKPFSKCSYSFMFSIITLCIITGQHSGNRATLFASVMASRNHCQCNTKSYSLKGFGCIRPKSFFT